MIDVDPGEVERALADVAGVASVAVDPGPGGGTLRLVLHPGADADAVGAEIRRRLAQRFGLGVDPGSGLPGGTAGGGTTEPQGETETPGSGGGGAMTPEGPRLAVLQGGAGTAPSTPTPVPPFRPRATRFRMVPGDREDVRIEVSVAAGPREATGAAVASATVDDLRRAAAEATARAVAGLRGDMVAAQVELVEVDEDATPRTARVQLTGGTGEPGWRPGSAEVGDDGRLAVVRAVLDAAAHEPAPSWWTRLHGSGPGTSP